MSYCNITFRTRDDPNSPADANADHADADHPNADHANLDFAMDLAQDRNITNLDDLGIYRLPETSEMNGL